MGVIENVKKAIKNNTVRVKKTTHRSKSVKPVWKFAEKKTIKTSKNKPQRTASSKKRKTITKAAYGKTVSSVTFSIIVISFTVLFLPPVAFGAENNLLDFPIRFFFIGNISDIIDDNRRSIGNEHLTRPTFGLSHETLETVVENGFQLNNQPFTITDNFYTPFSQQTVYINKVNTFEAKTYADKKLHVQEFLFGIPKTGQAHLAELGVEVWYDIHGNIQVVKAVQKSNVVDKSTLIATHEKSKCKSSDIEEKCDTTKISLVFLESLKYPVMAVKAIDYKNRYHITYLNEGIRITGDSLNPMLTAMIPSNLRDQGLLKVIQLAKYSPYWQSEDGRMFEMNNFGSFKEINQIFERFQDSGDARTRLHSEFGKVIEQEVKRAVEIFDANELISELPDSFAYVFPETDKRLTDEMKAKMLDQENIANMVLEEYKMHARK